MATVNKNFKIKQGLVVEGTTATVNNFDILTKKQADQDYIVNLIGGTATSANEANKVVKRDANGDFAAGVITADLVGDVTGTVSSLSNHDTADLAENAANKYFTNQRAIDANTGLWDTIGAAATAQSNAEDYTDTREGLITTAYEAYADQAELDAKAYTDTRETAITTAYQNYADAAETDAKAYTDTRETAITNAYESYADDAADSALAGANTYTDNRETAITTAYEAYADQAELDAVATANAYTDAEVSALVDSAPELLDTLNELAAAIADNPNYATDAANAVAGRVAKSGDTMTGDLTLPGAPTLTLHAATKGYVDQAETDAVASANSYTDGRETAITTAYQNYADAAESDAVTTANSYTDGEITTALSTAQGYANTAEQNAKDYADDLTTSDIAEGTNLYFTNQRAIDAVGGTIGDQINLLDTDDIEEGSANLYHTDARAKASAAALLTSASLTNIAITGNSTTGLIITAENGVADSDTDDLVEGSTNLYFTDVRAVDALEAVVPNFTAVELNSVAKQVAATLSAPTAGVQVAHAFAKADYRSAEYLVKVAYGTHTEISKVLLTLDSSDNIAITEYGIVGTNGSASSVSAGISGSNVQLQVTTANNDSTVTVVGTLLA
jgi:hypothetical protein